MRHHHKVTVMGPFALQHPRCGVDMDLSVTGLRDAITVYERATGTSPTTVWISADESIVDAEDIVGMACWHWPNKPVIEVTQHFKRDMWAVGEIGKAWIVGSVGS